MTVLTLTNEHIFRITKERATFDDVSFLKPMADPAMALHEKIKKLCGACNKTPVNDAKKQLAAAFGRLVYDESKRSPNGLAALHVVVNRALKSAVDQFSLEVTLENVKHEIKF